MYEVLIWSGKGKTRITIFIDDVILEDFRARAEDAGIGYQTMINDARKEYLNENVDQPVTETVQRRILHEEFPQLTQSSSH